MTKPARYSVQNVTSVCVILKDDFDPADPTLSVTNDAERVVEEVYKSYPGKRIFYYDTEGDIAELVHDKGKFTRFVPFDDIRPV